jgi:hypothetical protein
MTQSKSKFRKNKDLLVEYQKAQDSAEHHDALAWQVSSIFFAGMLVLMGFLLSNLEDNVIPNIIISLVGIIICIILIGSLDAFHKIIQRKYDRCHEIEKLFGFNQHLNEKGKNYKIRQYFMIIIILIIILWTALLMSSLLYNPIVIIIN